MKVKLVTVYFSCFDMFQKDMKKNSREMNLQILFVIIHVQNYAKNSK